MKLLPIIILATTTTATAQQQIGSSTINNNDGNINQLAHKLQQRKKSHQHNNAQVVTTRSLQNTQSSICSCSPQTFNIRINLSSNCEVDTIKDNSGIAGTLCLLGDAPSNVLPSPSNNGGGGGSPSDGGNNEIPPPITPDDPFLPPRPSPTTPSTPTTPQPFDAATRQPASTPDVEMPTWWPTFSPTTLDWAAGAAGGMPTAQNGQGGGNVPQVGGETYSPTVPWPTYAPTSGVEDEQQRGSEVNPADSMRDINVESGKNEQGLTKQELKKIKTQVRNSGGNISDMKQIRIDGLKSNLLNQHGLSVEEYEEMNKKDRKVVKKQVRMFDTMESMMGSSSGGGGSENDEHHSVAYNVAHLYGTHSSDTDLKKSKPTYYPTSTTLYPTDDGTYSPTSGGRRKLEDSEGLDSSYEPTSTSHLRNLELHSSSGLGQWTSLLPNDEFFTKFPEFKDRQEEIYRMRTRSHRVHEDEITIKSTYGGDISNGRQLQFTPSQLLSAQFLEMDPSENMNIINQDDQYLSNSDIPLPEMLSFTSISSTLDPTLSLEEQIDIVPGGVILILVGMTEGGEIMRNRVMWTYSMSCGDDDWMTIGNGDEYAWAMFQQPQPASEVFCPALEGQTSSPTLPPVDITVPTPPPSASVPTPPDGTPTKSPVDGPPDTPSPTKRPTSKKPSSAISGSGSNDYDVNVDPESIGHGAKAGKPHKIPDGGLSMPGNGLIMDHFDLSTSRSGKRRQLDSNQIRRANTQGSRFMMKKRDRRQQDMDEEAFGTHRRIAKHREETANRRRDVLFVDENVEEEEEQIVMTKVDSRRLRRN